MGTGGMSASIGGRCVSGGGGEVSVMVTGWVGSGTFTGRPCGLKRETRVTCCCFCFVFFSFSFLLDKSNDYQSDYN